MEAALGNSKDYSLKQYIKFADKLQTKAKVRLCDITMNIELGVMKQHLKCPS